jgi:hypothetical protein
MIEEGVISTPFPKDFPIPMIATRDIGWKAADFLDASFPHLREVFEMVGPKPVTFQEVTEILSRAFDCPELRYEQISLEEEKKRFCDSGMNQQTAEIMVEMEKAYCADLIKPTHPITQEHRGTTTLETFMQMVAHRNLAAR